jgi:hypothetical protein
MKMELKRTIQVLNTLNLDKLIVSPLFCDFRHSKINKKKLADIAAIIFYVTRHCKRRRCDITVKKSSLFIY